MNILFVVHNYVGNGPNHGGTELHVRDMVELYQQDPEHHVWLLYPKHGTAVLSYLLVDTKTGLQDQFDVSYPVSWECYQHEDFNQKVSALLYHHQIDLVHFYHLIHFPLNFPLVAQQSGAKVLISFFDYYLICRKFNLLTDNDSRFCGYPNVCLATCDICLRSSLGYGAGTQQNRRQLISEIMYHADAVHYLSEDVRERFIREYPQLTTKNEVVLGLGMKQSRSPATAALPSAEEEFAQPAHKPLRIACIGNFARQKGADLILAVIEHYRGISASNKMVGREALIHFELFGNPQYPYDSQIDLFSEAEVATVHGKYHPDDLPRLLAGCDVALFASIWPETFALVLSEAWACGIVPVAPRLGAFGERITDHLTGRLFDVVDDPGSVIEVLNELVESPECLTVMRQAIAEIVPLTLADNVRVYSEMYRKIMTSGEEAVPAVASIYLDQRPSDWHYVISSTGAIAPPPVQQPRDPVLARRAWGVLKQRGIRYTIWAALNYKQMNRG